MAEQLGLIDRRFNKNYLEMILGFLEGCEDGDPQKAAFQESFEHWYDAFDADESSLAAADCFYRAVGDHHDLLLANDERLFDECPGFFAHAFCAEGIDSWEFYNSFDSGVDENGELLPEDSKLNLWESLVGLYRLSTILCVYLKMPMVKQIMDLLISENKDIGPENIVQKVVSNFNNNRKMRKLIIQLMNATEDEASFQETFTSLQRVFASLAGKVNLNPADSARSQLNKTFSEILATAKCELPEDQKSRLFNAMGEKNQEVLDALVDENVLSAEQLSVVQKEFATPKVQQAVQQSRMVGDLGSTMKQMMEAYKSGNDDQMQELFAKTAPNLGISKDDIAAFQREYEEDNPKNPPPPNPETPNQQTPETANPENQEPDDPNAIDV